MKITRLRKKPEELINIELVITATLGEIKKLEKNLSIAIDTDFEYLDTGTEAVITSFLELIKEQLD